MNKSIFPLLIAILSVQLGATFAKQLFPVLGAGATTALRISFAALIMLLIFRPWRGKSLDKKARKLVVIYGLALGGMNLLFYYALELLPQGITVALEFVGPLALAVLLSRKALDFVWAALAVLGIVLLLESDFSASQLNWLGVAYALGAGLCWAFYIFFGQKIGSTTTGMKAISWGMCLAALLTLPFGLVSKGADLWQPSLLPAVLAVALLSSVIPYSLELNALKKISAKTFGILMSLEPAVAALVAYFFLQEKLGLTQWIGIFSISLASMGTSLRPKKS